MRSAPDAESESTPALETELFVRSLAPTGARERQMAVLERLEELVERSILADVCVSVWGEQVDLRRDGGRTATGARVHDRIDDLRSWADDHGRTLEPFIETRQRCSTVTGEDGTVLVLPVMLLAEYRDGAVAHVTPSADGNDVYSVVDRVETLEEATPPQPSA